ncbi:MAG: alanine racemase [Tepidiformaceae bacterium]
MTRPPLLRETLRGPVQLAEATRARNAWIEIDMVAIEANVAALRGLLGPGVELIAVVKANAYGAGVEGFAPVLEAAGVDRFAVVWPAEALALRAFGITKPVMVLGHAFPEDASAAVAAAVTLTCHSLELGQALSQAALEQGRTADVQVKVDSGLHRFGLGIDAAVALAEALRELPSVRVSGLTTHMANADEADDTFAEHQHAVFAEAAWRLPWIPYRHTANSATALRRQELRYDGVRIGLALHGVLPANTTGPALKSVLSLKARLARVSEVPKGEGVSYGLAWRAERDAIVGLVPVGYADGWPRNLGNSGSVLVHGRRCAMVGRVCMDQFLVDVTDLPGVAEGDEVVLLGEQGPENITAANVAALAGTIPWDVFASLQARLPRLFQRGGVVERVLEA